MGSARWLLQKLISVFLTRLSLLDAEIGYFSREIPRRGA
jgi:hypothetical protein